MLLQEINEGKWTLPACKTVPAFQSIVCIFQIIKRKGDQIEAKNSSFGIQPDSLPTVEFQPCTGRKVGWGRALCSPAPEQGKGSLTEAAGKPLSSSAALADPTAINTISTAGVLGEQHASRLRIKWELVEPHCSSYQKSWTQAIPKLPLWFDYLMVSCCRSCASASCCGWLSTQSSAQFFSPVFFFFCFKIIQSHPPLSAFTWLCLQKPKAFY